MAKHDRRAELTLILNFIKETEGLKGVERTAWLTDGQRETTAEHSWRLALLAGLISDFYPEVDKSRLLTMCLIHDIGELYDGDVSALRRPDHDHKYAVERAAAQKVFAKLPEPAGDTLLAIWQEYNDGVTPTARLAKALDKTETIIQHNQGQNPADFNYAFNLLYGQEYFHDPLLQDLRSLIDNDTKTKLG